MRLASYNCGELGSSGYEFFLKCYANNNNCTSYNSGGGYVCEDNENAYISLVSDSSAKEYLSSGTKNDSSLKDVFTAKFWEYSTWYSTNEDAIKETAYDFAGNMPGSTFTVSGTKYKVGECVVYDTVVPYQVVCALKS